SWSTDEGLHLNADPALIEHAGDGYPHGDEGQPENQRGPLGGSRSQRGVENTPEQPFFGSDTTPARDPRIVEQIADHLRQKVDGQWVHPEPKKRLRPGS